jgi:hypothetical protein
VTHLSVRVESLTLAHANAFSDEAIADFRAADSIDAAMKVGLAGASRKASRPQRTPDGVLGFGNDCFDPRRGRSRDQLQCDPA